MTFLSYASPVTTSRRAEYPDSQRSLTNISPSGGGSDCSLPAGGTAATDLGRVLHPLPGFRFRRQVHGKVAAGLNLKTARGNPVSRYTREGSGMISSRYSSSIDDRLGLPVLFRGLDECSHRRIGLRDQSGNALDSPSIRGLKHVGVTVEVRKIRAGEGGRIQNQILRSQEALIECRVSK